MLAEAGAVAPATLPDGFTLLTDRDFATKARTAADVAGADGWRTIEFAYSNLFIRDDAGAPRSGSNWIRRGADAGSVTVARS